MNVKNKIAALAFVALSATAASSAAQAQLALQNGTFMSISGNQTAGSGITFMNLGNASSDSAFTVLGSMPMSLTYGSVTANITFAGGSRLVDGGLYAPGPNNYIMASASGGGVTLDFSQTQSYFATRWMAQDPGNNFSFYNGDQLVASVTGATAQPLSLAATGSSSGYADFNFTEAGYDRVVVTSSFGAVEFGEIAFSGEVQAAPIPLNAASLGGLMSFLMMLAMRGKGGTQVMVRMAFASIMPKRRTLA